MKPTDNHMMNPPTDTLAQMLARAICLLEASATHRDAVRNTDPVAQMIARDNWQAYICAIGSLRDEACRLLAQNTAFRTHLGLK